ncbi:MAG: TonB-dependent receptor [Bacteroidaceae bacterium]|nr:TonB-dependent receptor [Bacteroidaceae bacterium]
METVIGRLAHLPQRQARRAEGFKDGGCGKPQDFPKKRNNNYLYRMRHRLYAILTGIAVALGATAQTHNVTLHGYVQDYETREMIPAATVQWLHQGDSAFVGGTTTQMNGSFELHKKVAAGKYLLRVSFMGYGAEDKTFTIDAKTSRIRLDTIMLKSDAIMLREAIIEAQRAEVQIVEDTVMFNAEALRIPEGSNLEELLRKLPGVDISDDGVIKMNGRTIDRLLVGGEEFFGNNKDIATKNLPANIVKKVKNYERKSELSRETGIDDGEEEFVLDLEIKKNMMQGWIGNFDAGYGQPLRKTEFVRELGINDLYTVNATMNRFESQQQYSVYANVGNAGGGSIGRGRGGGGAGLTNRLNGGFNMAKNFGEKWQQNQYQYRVGGNVNFGMSTTNSQSKSSSATYLQNGSSSFSNRWSQNFNDNKNVSGDFQFEWRPDTLWSIIFRPNFSYNTGGSMSSNLSATFNQDPEETIASLYPGRDFSPLDSAWTDTKNNSRINYGNSANYNENENTNVSASLQIVKKFHKQGRNLTFRGNGSYSTSKGNSRSSSFTRFYQRNDSTSTINRINYNPSSSHNLNGRLMWSEPIALATYLSFSYQASYRYRNSNRSTYDLPSTWSPNLDAAEWLWEEEAYNAYKSERLSRFSKDEQFNRDLSVQLRRVTDNYNLNAGFSLQPQTRHMEQIYLNTPIDTTRTVFNWTPTLFFRYRWDKQTSLNMNYRGRSSEPELTQLIEIVDDSNPMNISTGNAGLKPTFNNNLRVEFRHSNPERLSNINVGVNGGNTLNNIVNQTTYNEETGGRITRPTNLDGFWSTWNANANVNYNTALKNQRFTVGTGTDAGYNHHESYLRTGALTATNTEYPLATTHDYNISENLWASYKNDWMDIRLSGNVRYNYAINEMQPEQKQNTWQYSYGPSANFNIPWQEIKISTNITMNSRRGYSSADFNTDELLWNGQISKSFLAQNAATVSIQFYDILGQMSNVTRNVTATGHSDTFSNSINSYFLVHFIYRLNLFGDRETRQQMRMNRPDRGGFPGGGFPGGGFPGGGFPGGGPF